MCMECQSDAEKLAQVKELLIVTCSRCSHWGNGSHTWNDARPCHKSNGNFFVDGGDGSDSLYTMADHGCLDGESK